MSGKQSKHEGGCLCGAVRFEVEGPPLLQGMCYCRACQRVSGGAPSLLAAYPAEALTLTEGAPKVFETKGDSGAVVRRAFCGACGTSLYSWSEGRPHVRSVKVGVLDDSAAFDPQLAIWTSAKQPWHEPPAEVAQYDAAPPASKVAKQS